MKIENSKNIVDIIFCDVFHQRITGASCNSNLHRPLWFENLCCIIPHPNKCGCPHNCS